MGNFWLDFDENTIPAPTLTKFTATIGDGKSCDFHVVHNINSNKIVAQAYNVSTGILYRPSYTIVNANQMTFHFKRPPAKNSVRIVIIG